eukprot:jgi/Tetstr1/444630/TSEL_032478.t1
MARVQSSTPGGGVDWQFRCCDGSCGRTYKRATPLCTHVNHGMEFDDPAVAAVHLAYAATFDPYVYLACGHCSAITRRLLPQPPMMPPSRLPLGEAAEGGADAAADGLPPAAVVDAHRRAAKLTAVQELRRTRQALDTANLGMVSDSAAALHVLEALHPPPAPTEPEYSPAEEPPDLRRAPPSWGGNADEVRRWGRTSGGICAMLLAFPLGMSAGGVGST